MTIGRLPSVEGGIQPTIVDSKGDLITATAADTPARLGIGSNNTVLTADSAEATGMKWATPAGGGKVLQVINATFSTTAASTSGTYADTGITATITPSSATSKVLIIASVCGLQAVGGTSTYGNLRLVRTSTELIVFENRYGLTNEAAHQNEIGGSSCNYLDNPSTTSATTYKIQFGRGAGAGTVRVCSDNVTSTITLLEIGA